MTVQLSKSFSGQGRGFRVNGSEEKRGFWRRFSGSLGGKLSGKVEHQVFIEYDQLLVR